MQVVEERLIGLDDDDDDDDDARDILPALRDLKVLEGVPTAGQARAGYNTKEKMRWHVIGKRNYIPEDRSLLADGNKSGQPDRAGEIAIQGRYGMGE
jgi:hypothetical protein